MASLKISICVVEKKLDEIKTKHEAAKELVQKLEDGLVQQKKNICEYEGAIVVLNQLLISTGSNEKRK